MMIRRYNFAHPIDRLTGLALLGLAAGAVLGVPEALKVADAKSYQLSAPVPSSATLDSPDDTPIVDDDRREPGAITRAADGLFYADVKINGTARRCLIDSGASGLTLDLSQARPLGIADHLAFDGSVATAGGIRSAARTRLAKLELAGRDLHDVPAVLVNGSGTPCLLGQNVLSRLKAVEMHGDRLVLR